MMKLEKRQMIMMLLFALALIILGWQIYDLWFGNNERVQQVNSKVEPLIQKPQQVIQASSVKPANLPPAAATNSAAQSSVAVNLSAPLSSEQDEYLKLVNQYQLLKMHRMVAEEEAAIAKAQDQIATLNAKTSQLQGTQVQGGAVTNYQLKYLDFQGGIWTATLAQNGRFQEVVAGSPLPPNGRVISIDREGVILAFGDQEYQLTFSGMKSLSLVSSGTGAPSVQTTPLVQPAAATIKPAAAPVSPSVPPKPKPHTTSALQAVQKDPPSLIAVAVSDPATTACQARCYLQQKFSILVDGAPQNVLTQMCLPDVTGQLNGQDPLNFSHFLQEALLQLKVPNKNTNQIKKTEAVITSNKPYTIQLLGSFSTRDIKEFKQRFPNLAGLEEYQTTYKNRLWHVLAYGNFATIAQARVALSELPLSIQQTRPWIRNTNQFPL